MYRKLIAATAISLAFLAAPALAANAAPQAQGHAARTLRPDRDMTRDIDRLAGRQVAANTNTCGTMRQAYNPGNVPLASRKGKLNVDPVPGVVNNTACNVPFGML